MLQEFGGWSHLIDDQDFMTAPEVAHLLCHVAATLEIPGFVQGGAGRPLPTQPAELELRRKQLAKQAAHHMAPVHTYLDDKPVGSNLITIDHVTRLICFAARAFVAPPAPARRTSPPPILESLLRIIPGTGVH